MPLVEASAGGAIRLRRMDDRQSSATLAIRRLKGRQRPTPRVAGDLRMRRFNFRAPETIYVLGRPDGAKKQCGVSHKRPFSGCRRLRQTNATAATKSTRGPDLQA